MLIEADWYDVSASVLTQVFEQQGDALDNTTAACACSNWRAAVYGTHIPALHLHAEHSSYIKEWHNFFRSRHSFGHLRWTAHLEQEGDTWAPGSPAHVHDHANSCLQSIPLECDSLELDASLSSELLLYIEQLPRP